MFRIGTWRKDDWAVCAFWVDDETGIGSCQEPDRIVEMFHRISGEGELRWTLGIKVTRDFDKTHGLTLIAFAPWNLTVYRLDSLFKRSMIENLPAQRLVAQR